MCLFVSSCNCAASKPVSTWRGAGHRGGLGSLSIYPSRNHHHIFTHLQQSVPGFIPPTNDLGKPGLRAAGLVLGNGWILVLKSWIVAACAKQIQENPGKRDWRCQQQARGELSVTRGRAIIPFCSCTFPLQSSTQLY